MNHPSRALFYRGRGVCKQTRIHTENRMKTLQPRVIPHSRVQLKCCFFFPLMSICRSLPWARDSSTVTQRAVMLSDRAFLSATHCSRPRIAVLGSLIHKDFIPSITKSLELMFGTVAVSLLYVLDQGESRHKEISLLFSARRICYQKINK